MLPPVMVVGQAITPINMNDTGVQIIIILLCVLTLAFLALRDAAVRAWNQKRLPPFLVTRVRGVATMIRVAITYRGARSPQSSTPYHRTMTLPTAATPLAGRSFLADTPAVGIPTSSAIAPESPTATRITSLSALIQTTTPAVVVPWKGDTWQIMADTTSALANPPNDLRDIIAYMRSEHLRVYGEHGKFLVPQGFTLEQGVPHQWFTRAIRGTNHQGVAGLSDTGKDSRMRNQAISLMLQHPPEEISLWILDGKGDWILFENKAHVRMCVRDPDDIEDAFKLLEEERHRRQTLINDYTRDHQVLTTWDTLPPEFRFAHDMPLMWVIVSELDMLMECFKTERAFEVALSRQLRASRSAGGRWTISTQRFNGKETSWRGMINHWSSGAQTFPTDDKPNTSLSTPQLRERGALPPSSMTLPLHAGVATVVAGNQAVTVRDPYLSGEEIGRLLATLPDRVLPLSQKAATKVAQKTPPPERRPSRSPAPMPRATSPAPSVVAETYPGPRMTLDEIAEYIARSPQIPQWRIERNLFGVSDETSYRTVCMAVERLRTSVTVGEPLAVSEE